MLTKTMGVSGMSCAACAKSAERAAAAVEGVAEAIANLASEKMRVTYDPGAVSIAQVAKAVSEAGFGLLEEETVDEADARREAAERDLRRRLAVSIAFAAPLFVVSMVPMALKYLPGVGLPEQIDPMRWPAANAILQLLLTIPVAAANWKIYAGGAMAILRRRPNMDSLIAKGTAAAFAYSLYLTWRNAFAGGHYEPYFEIVGVILTLIVLGRSFEGRAKGRAGAAVKKLMGLAPRTALVIRRGAETEVFLDEVVVGDIVVVRPGQRAPADGEAVEGEAFADESMLTGESMPVAKGPGSAVVGGSVIQGGFLKFRAAKVGRDTALAQIAALVEEAQGSKPPIAALADRVCEKFVPAVFALAVLSALAWHFIGGESAWFAARIFVTVLVIACPCALGLATPVSVMVAVGKGAQAGILVKSAGALQAAASVGVVALDKTGTVTEGRPRVTDVVAAGGFGPGEALLLAAAAEKNSEHPLARAIAAKALEEGLEPPEPSSFSALAGLGVSACVGGRSVLAGSARLMALRGADFSCLAEKAESLAGEGKTPMLVAVDGKPAALIALADAPRPGSAAAVARMRGMGLEAIMITGDSRRAALAAARQAGIGEVVAEALPGGKAGHVAALQARGARVAMVGDGVNDAPALAQADVGIAMGSGADIAMDSAGIVLMRSDLGAAASAIALSRKAMANIRQNLFWAFAYNALGIPVAMGALHVFGGPLLNPMIAAAAMALSSASVLANALRLRRAAV